MSIVEVRPQKLRGLTITSVTRQGLKVIIIAGQNAFSVSPGFCDRPTPAHKYRWMRAEKADYKRTYSNVSQNETISLSFLKNAEIIAAPILTTHEGYNYMGEEVLLRKLNLVCKSISVCFEWVFKAVRHKTASLSQKKEYIYRDLLVHELQN